MFGETTAPCVALVMDCLPAACLDRTIAVSRHLYKAASHSTEGRARKSLYDMYASTTIGVETIKSLRGGVSLAYSDARVAEILQNAVQLDAAQFLAISAMPEVLWAATFSELALNPEPPPPLRGWTPGVEPTEKDQLGQMQLHRAIKHIAISLPRPELAFIMPEEEDLPDSACAGWPADWVVEVRACGGEGISLLQIVQAINEHPLAPAAVASVISEGTYELVWAGLHRIHGPSHLRNHGFMHTSPTEFICESVFRQFPFEFASVGEYKEFVDSSLYHLLHERVLSYELKWELNLNM